MILIAIFLGINVGVNYLDPTAIDCTTSQSFTLTDESIERVADIEDEVNIYFVGWEDSDTQYTLAKQYNKANENINVEIIDASEDLEFAKKYDVENDDYAVIVECGEVTRTLSYYDLYTYDSDYNTIDLTEQKLTSAILNVTSGEIPKVYYLTGYTSFSFDNGLYILSMYLDDEVLTYEELNILNTQAVPDDCDTLIIMTPEEDFDDIVADAIIDYINEGGNILWLNGAYVEDMELTNVNRVLAEFGIDAFESGVIFETDSGNTIGGAQLWFMPTIEYTDITEDVYSGNGAIFYAATKINIDEDALEDLNVEETDLVLSEDTTYFSTDVSTLSKDEQGGFVLGTQMVKTIQEAVEEDEEEGTEAVDAIEAKLTIYGNDYFASDLQLASNYSYMIYLSNNADLVLNSLADLTDRDQDITIRKSYTDSETEFTPTDEQAGIIMAIIFVVPIAIILLGIVVWQIRKRRI